MTRARRSAGWSAQWSTQGLALWLAQWLAHWPFVAFAIAVALAPLVVPAFYVTLLNYIGLATLVALGLVLLTGIAGIVSFGQQAFVGIAAYTTAVMTTTAGLSPWIALPAALALVGVFGLVLGAITLRLSGHCLSIATIAWGIALYYVFGNLPGLGAYSGIDDLPPITLAGWPLDTAPRIYYLIWTVTIAALVAATNLLDSRTGRALRALRFRGVMAESFGVDTARLKVLIFLYAALLAGVSGWLHAHFLRFVSPHAFGVNAGIDYLFMAVIGGASHVWGAVIGSSVLTMLREWLKDLLPAAIQRTGNYEIVVFGVLMLVLLQRTRNGIAPALARLLPAPKRRTPSLQAAPLPRREQPTRGEPLLELDAVRIRFGGLVAVNRMSFELRSGEILGLIGPNGAGKTTMFNLITGVLQPESGRIRFLGERIDTLGQRGIARRGVARTFQHVNLVSSMSVLENVAIGAHLRGRSGTLAAMAHAERVEDERLLAEAARQLQRVGLGEHLHEPAGSLALGQQRIVEIARALAADPILLLLDEPAAGLRFAEKQALAALLRRLRDERISVLLVEHDMDFVMGLVDRLVVMDFGEKLAEGAPQAIQSDAAVLEAYLGGIE
ncbi:MAG: branched-chain amino acid ABC transporter ATP-binding protein/permease [Burkholderiaceae bacterium]|nr:branched-chain amino acid ABC transporter ATP-binding protein/permease [Burkholderiaceae bacterium]